MESNMKWGNSLYLWKVHSNILIYLQTEHISLKSSSNSIGPTFLEFPSLFFNSNQLWRKYFSFGTSRQIPISWINSMDANICHAIMAHSVYPNSKEGMVQGDAVSCQSKLLELDISYFSLWQPVILVCSKHTFKIRIDINRLSRASI